MIQVEDICAVRKRLGLSQEKLAEELGVSRNTISRWERGEFNPTADKIAALEQLIATLEPPEEAPAAEEQTAPTKARRWPVMLACAGIICALLIGIASLIGIYSIKQQIPADRSVPIEEVEREEVDKSFHIVSGTTQPLQP